MISPKRTFYHNGVGIAFITVRLTFIRKAVDVYGGTKGRCM